MERKMEKISIKTGRVNIFKPVQHNNNEQKHSNPFGLSFKGNVLQADVFSSSKTKTTYFHNLRSASIIPI